MKEIIPDLKRWRAEGKEIALTTIVETQGSSLRPAGTRMALTADGEVAGSVSSGCVDGDAIAEMEAVLRGGVPIRRPFFGVSDELAWSTGLACGGSIDLLVERWDPLHDLLIAEMEAGRPVGFASRTDDRPAHLLRDVAGHVHGSLGDAALDRAVIAEIEAHWPGPYTRKQRFPQGEVFIEVIPQPPVLLIFGATDIAIPLAKMGRILDFRVIVSDARRTFLREGRFPDDVETRFGWPQDVFTAGEMGPGWAVVVLFHDRKFDIPALSLALRSEAFYIGFLGSRKTQADRRADLRAEGFTDEQLARIHGPVGLDIGGKAPAMIALSILAEIVAVRHRRSGGMLVRRGRDA